MPPAVSAIPYAGYGAHHSPWLLLLFLPQARNALPEFDGRLTAYTLGKEIQPVHHRTQHLAMVSLWQGPGGKVNGTQGFHMMVLDGRYAFGKHPHDHLAVFRLPF